MSPFADKVLVTAEYIISLSIARSNSGGVYRGIHNLSLVLPKRVS